MNYSQINREMWKKMKNEDKNLWILFKQEKKIIKLQIEIHLKKVLK